MVLVEVAHLIIDIHCWSHVLGDLKAYVAKARARVYSVPLNIAEAGEVPDVLSTCWEGEWERAIAGRGIGV